MHIQELLSQCLYTSLGKVLSHLLLQCKTLFFALQFLVFFVRQYSMYVSTLETCFPHKQVSNVLTAVLTKFVRAIFAKFCTDRFQYEFKKCSNARGADVPSRLQQAHRYFVDINVQQILRSKLVCLEKRVSVRWCVAAKIFADAPLTLRYALFLHFITVMDSSSSSFNSPIA